MKKASEIIIYPSIAVVVMLLVWQGASLVVGSSFVLPSINETIGAMREVLVGERIYSAVIGTVLRSLIAFAVSGVVAFLLTIVSEINAGWKSAVRVVMGVMRSVPTISIILLFIVWTISTVTPVLVTIVIVLPMLYSGMSSAREAIEWSLIENTRLMPLSRLKKLMYVYVPLCMPITLEAMANAVSLSVKLVVASELLSQAGNALGMLMQEARLYYEMAELFSYTFIAIALSLVLEYAVRLVKYKFFSDM